MRRLPALLTLALAAPPSAAAAADVGVLRSEPVLRRGLALPARYALSFDTRGSVRLRVGALTRRLRGSHHLEATPAALAVDGVRARGRPGSGRLSGGVLRNVLLTRGDRPAALLLHRVAALHARTPAGRFPLGEGDDGRLRFQRGWTSGFWPGVLWRASDLAGEPFGGWALSATERHFGREDADTHDLGFLYGSSSVAAYERLCAPTVTAPVCGRLRASALRAAQRLRALAATNAAAGTIPVNSRDPDEADTIIDSLMNLELLGWAARATGDAGYFELMRRHAHAVAATHLRADGSTFQSVHQRRSDGAVLRRHTHQGLSDGSTWARGQAWAVHGFAQTALDLSDAALAGAAERAAAYVEAELPGDGVPRYDYDAAAPRDYSAAVITAAGLYRLDAACRALAGACADAARWRPLADRMLAAALRHVSRLPPLGRLGDQVYALGGRRRWDDRAELVLGLYYALEAVSAAPSSARG